jgi:ribokinase
MERLAVPTVVVTLGARGSCARHQGRLHFQAAYSVTPVDTTGAGDTFCGSLVAALSQGQPLPDALQFASAASAIACTRWGAQSSIAPKAEIHAFMDANPGTSPAQVLELKAWCEALHL